MSKEPNAKSDSPEVHWLDFSGAPPLLIPRILVSSWRGTRDPKTGTYRDCDTSNPVTDYDRACSAAWPGKSTVEVKGIPVLSLYTEYDFHTWDSRRQILACGGWLPSDEVLRSANWSEPIHWCASHTDYLLMNSAVDASDELRKEDFVPVVLPSGTYTIEYASISSHFAGCFHRFRRNELAR